MKNRKEQFNKDLNWGKWGERTMWPYLEMLYSINNRKLSYWYDSDYDARNLKGKEYKNKLKEYDLKFGYYLGDRIYCEKEVTFEVKTDKYDYTGNLAFEIKDKGIDSGVMGTSADYFIYFLPRFQKNNIYIIKTEVMRELLSRDKFKMYYNYGGDLGKTLNIIVPINEFDDDFKNVGGKILTFTSYTIPEDFNVSKIESKDKVVYQSDEIKKYDDPFNF